VAGSYFVRAGGRLKIERRVGEDSEHLQLSTQGANVFRECADLKLGAAFDSRDAGLRQSEFFRQFHLG